jgi:hypothetical protein
MRAAPGQVDGMGALSVHYIGGDNHKGHARAATAHHWRVAPEAAIRNDFADPWDARTYIPITEARLNQSGEGGTVVRHLPAQADRSQRIHGGVFRSPDEALTIA